MGGGDLTPGRCPQKAAETRTPGRAGSWQVKGQREQDPEARASLARGLRAIWGAGEPQGSGHSSSGAPGSVGAGCPKAQSPSLLLGIQSRNQGPTSHLLHKKTQGHATGTLQTGVSVKKPPVSSLCGC